ncbi:hypothetical protein [Dehalobacterium formicoaceticum]|uniref:hypothetical protein n=1 Tax=Dehalobacterium formicoaceticum TaxID=51515 RepID=UPI000B7F35E8|nr:hypothetical protein [Dehalobacterium formicoaceticum]
MKSLGKIKRGDTFSFTAELKDNVTGDVLTGIADKLRCQCRTNGTHKLIDEMVIAEITPGTYLFSAGQTDDWGAGFRLLLDIEYTYDNVVSSSETFFVDVEADITHG